MQTNLAKLGLALVVGVATLGCLFVVVDFRLLPAILLILAQIALLVVPVASRIMRRTFDVLEVGPLYALLYCLYSLPLIINRLFISGTPDFETTTLYLFATTTGLASFWAGYRWKVGRRAAQMIPLLGPPVHTRLITASIAFGMMGTALLYLFFRNFGGVAAYIAIGYGGELHIASEGTGLTAAGLHILIMSGGLLWFYGMAKRSVVWALAGILVSVPLVLIRLQVGDRGTIVGLLIVFLTGFHYLHRRISPRAGAIILGVGYVGALTFGVGRYALRLGGLDTVASWTSESFKWEWLLPTRFGEFMAVAQSLYDLIETRARLEYLYGASYLKLLLIMIPSALLSERPEALSQWYVRLYNPGMWRAGGGMAFFTGAESFLNFWFFGPFIQFFMYGLILGVVYEYFQRQRQNPAAVFVYALLLRWIFAMIRIDFATAMKSLLAFGVGPAALAALFVVGARFVDARQKLQHIRRPILPVLTPRSAEHPR